MRKDEQTFIGLVTQHQGIIHKVCSMYCDDDIERRDLFQEILMQLWRSFPTYKGQAKLSTWMYRVALNTAISSFRKQKHRYRQVQLSEREFAIPYMGKDADWEEKKSVLYKAIQQLSEVERAIVMLYLEENSYEEIAAIMGISKVNVGVKLNRIKGKLKKMMTPLFI